MLKKLFATLLSTAMFMSCVTAFAASDRATEVAPEEGTYGTKYLYHQQFDFLSGSGATIMSTKQTTPETYAAHISEKRSYSGSKALYLDFHNVWWKQYFSTNFNCDLTAENSNTVSGTHYYVDPRNGNIEFSVKMSGDFAHTAPNAGLLDDTGTTADSAGLLAFSEMTCVEEEIDGVKWRTYSYSGAWPGTGWLLGIGGTHACGTYFDDMYLKVGNVVVIDEDFEASVNTDIKTVDAVAATANGNNVRLSWRNPYFADITKLEIYDITDGANTSILSLTAENSTTAPNVAFSKDTDCYFDIANVAAADKQYKIITSTSYFENVETTVNYTAKAEEPDEEKTTDDEPYGTLYLNHPYFKFESDSALETEKLGNPGTFAAHISEVKSYSGSKALYLDCENRWWRQHFHTSHGCELDETNSNVSTGTGTYYVNPNNQNIQFSMKLAGDFTNIVKYAGLNDVGGTSVTTVLFEDMEYSSETIDGVEWRTYTYNATWPGDGYLLNVGGTYASGAYIDDFYLKVGNVVVIDEDFETSVNSDISTIEGVNITPINDTTLRIGWVNPYLSDITKLEIYDITNGASNSVLSLTGADSTKAPNAVFTKRTACWYDITGLAAQTYKKYKIVFATADFGEKEIIVDGRTMKAENNIVANKYDENGFAFGGSWIANIGDSTDGGNGNQGSWTVDFDQKRSGNASFKINHYGYTSRLEWGMGTKTLLKDTPYIFEAYVKVGDKMPVGNARLYIVNGSSVKYATVLTKKITDGDWQKLTYTVTPTEDTDVTMLRLGFFAENPTEIYVDDIKFYTSTETIIDSIYSDAGLAISEPTVNVNGTQKAVSWRHTVLYNAVSDMGFNVYYIDEEGTETKLNQSIIELVDEITTTNLYVIDTLLPGTYEIRMVSALGIEAGAISTVVEDIMISDGVFKTVYWNEGFNQYGENYDDGISFGIDELNNYGDTLGTITVTNYSTEYTDGLPVCLFGALYKDGSLVSVVKNPITTAAYGDITSLSVAFETTQISDLTGYEMKLFLWDTATGMKPLIDGATPVISGPVAD